MATDDRRAEILSAVITVTAAAFIAMVLRVSVRLKMAKMLAWDDIVMLVATVVCVGGLGIVIVEVQNGHGQHFTELTGAHISTGIFFNFMSGPVYLAATTLVKASIGLFLLRIAPNMYYCGVIWAVLVVNVIFGVMGIFEVCFQCTDIRVLWDPSVKSTCLPATTLQAMSFLFQAVNIITDFFFALLPVPMLWHVQINSKTKASICCILGLGIFACAASIVKALFIGTYKTGPDYLYDVSDLTIWTATEVNTGIIAGCLPSLKPLFSRILSSTYRSNPYGGASGTGRRSAKKPGNPSTDKSSRKSHAFSSRNSNVHAILLQDRPPQLSTPRREWFDTEAGMGGGFDDSEENLTGGSITVADGTNEGLGNRRSREEFKVTKSTTIAVTVETVDQSERDKIPPPGGLRSRSHLG